MSKIQDIKTMIDSAEAALKNAKKMLQEIDPGVVSHGTASYSTSSPVPSDVSKIIEGVFNGERMVGPDGQMYPIPANYASKSKLVAGDHLKLTILQDGKFLYKQIGPVPRKNVIGTLIQEEGQFKVLANSKSYRVLLASVTYYRAQIGDKVTIIIPEADDSQWCTIEAVLPKDVSQLNVMDDQPEPEEMVDF